MSEQTKSNGNAFIGWGIFLHFFPAIAGSLFLLSTSFNFFQYLFTVVVFSYIIWGWASIIIGIILITLGVKRKRLAASGAKVESQPDPLTNGE